MDVEDNIKLEISDELLKERYKCELCFQLMRNPVQTMRGYSACKSCYTQAAVREDGRCPIDGEPIATTFSKFFFNDRAKNKEISKLKCHCSNVDDGCSWNGNVNDFQNHRTACEYIKELCQYCNIAVTKDYGLEHFQQCNGINKIGDCIFMPIGCLFKAEYKEEMTKHMEVSNHYHLMLQSKHMKKLEKESIEACQKINNQVQVFNNKDKQHQKDIAEMGNLIQTLQKNFQVLQDDVKKHFLELRQQNSSTNQNIQEHSDARNTEPATSENLVVHERKIDGNDTKNIDKINKQNKEMANIIKKNVGNISELDLRLQLHENTSYDGRILWKIDRFDYRRTQAITGKITALHSAPCFVGQYKYKFCTRLYMNGDGMGRGTHLSLFIVLMKSEYDDLLEWPFQKQVYMTLINQKDQKLNIVEKLIPNKDSSSFQKPKKDMNVASGCPLFVRIDGLERNGFVVNDCMYLEIKVGGGELEGETIPG